MKLTTAQQMRELDRKAIQERGIPSIDLMERAAEGVARAALSALREKPARCRAAVFCGAGNNGGDGIAAARLLFLEGVRVRAFLVGSYEKLTPDALEETRRLSECGVELEPYDPEDLGQRAWARGSQVLIDAIFGVGLSRPIAPESPFGAAIALMNDCPGAVVAADMLSQAEHDKMASAVLLTDSGELAEAVRDEIERQLSSLPRKEIARASVDNRGRIVILPDIPSCAALANTIAPEHLELFVDDPFAVLDLIRNAGSIFMGRNCPEALGDYLAGPNHTLPTSGTARFSSPLSVDDFIKKTQFTYYTADALAKEADDIAAFARAEGLEAHARSALSRRKKEISEK